MRIIQSSSKPINLQLSRNLTRNIKRGHAWVYADALRKTPQVKPGSSAVLLDNKGGREIARGYYTPSSPLALRICTTLKGVRLNDAWAAGQMAAAYTLRRSLLDEKTTAYRLFNGEGDGLPGLVVDVYADTAVLKLDGEAAEGFWDAEGIAHWLHEHAEIVTIYQRFKSRGGPKGRILLGETPDAPIRFLENGLHFSADVVRGQKTGFFIDQRDNRALVGRLSKGKRVLNMFGYTGGFSVYAGAGGAVDVKTVDQAQPAVDMANTHWAMNNLPDTQHEGITADAFEFLDDAAKTKTRWDFVILDPPSFAPSEEAVTAAENAYTRLISKGAMVTERGGLLAAASCSSHIRGEHFLKICEDAISQARRTATVLGVYGQPTDHPAPLVMEELRYLKFILMKLD